MKGYVSFLVYIEMWSYHSDAKNVPFSQFFGGFHQKKITSKQNAFLFSYLLSLVPLKTTSENLWHDFKIPVPPTAQIHLCFPENMVWKMDHMATRVYSVMSDMASSSFRCGLETDSRETHLTMQIPTVVKWAELMMPYLIRPKVACLKWTWVTWTN